ncbi:MAG: ABC transporter ATP-binding protein, partial [Pseudomonadota bacterium]
KTGVQVLEALDHVNRELGATTIVITHNIGIAEMSDRTIRLSDGKIATITNVGRAKRPAELSW